MRSNESLCFPKHSNKLNNKKKKKRRKTVCCLLFSKFTLNSNKNQMRNKNFSKIENRKKSPFFLLAFACLIFFPNNTHTEFAFSACVFRFLCMVCMETASFQKNFFLLFFGSDAKIVLDIII